ncbi:hypothetical protein EVAR_55386_1 [Eumeta japonica]|uniref:Uncharacterized protein n=1 Tax=Eumeta variegata TaxID=151549 RepID=A0A4C1YS81_EUMVA|nr:hypothetical protein EVAR_55386_1 [Eumeta japonica]
MKSNQLKGAKAPRNNLRLCFAYERFILSDVLSAANTSCARRARYMIVNRTKPIRSPDRDSGGGGAEKGRRRGKEIQRSARRSYAEWLAAQTGRDNSGSSMLNVMVAIVLAAAPSCAAAARRLTFASRPHL